MRGRKGVPALVEAVACNFAGIIKDVESGVAQYGLSMCTADCRCGAISVPEAVGTVVSAWSHR